MYYESDPDLIGGKLVFWIDTALARMGVTGFDVDTSRLDAIAEKMSNVSEPDGFPHEEGFEAASVYKKAAYFFHPVYCVQAD